MTISHTTCLLSCGDNGAVCWRYIIIDFWCCWSFGKTCTIEKTDIFWWKLALLDAPSERFPRRYKILYLLREAEEQYIAVSSEPVLTRHGRHYQTWICIFLSLPLHRAFRKVTWLVHQPMHTHKTVYIKTFKIAPTCFDHAIIIRELRCSLLKLHY